MSGRHHLADEFFGLQLQPRAAACRNAAHPACLPTVQIFTRTCDNTRKIALMLRNLGFGAIPIHGQMSQPKRLGAMNKFKAGERNILVATDVASRGAAAAQRTPLPCCHWCWGCRKHRWHAGGGAGVWVVAAAASATSAAAAARCGSLQAHGHACMCFI